MAYNYKLGSLYHFKPINVNSYVMNTNSDYLELQAWQNELQRARRQRLMNRRDATQRNHKIYLHKTIDHLKDDLRYERQSINRKFAEMDLRGKTGLY